MMGLMRDWVVLGAALLLLFTFVFILAAEVR